MSRHVLQEHEDGVLIRLGKIHMPRKLDRSHTHLL
jgi:hypothetical protein